MSDKKLFAEEGSDGMTIDDRGNIYLTNKAVQVYSSQGKKIKTIQIPESPSNVTFGGLDKSTLFITDNFLTIAVIVIQCKKPH